MNAKDAIRTVWDTGERVLNAYLSDLEDRDLLVRPVEGQNHIAWQLGHLLLTERNFLESMDPGASPALPEGFADAHARNETAPKSDDATRFLGKERYLELMAAQRQASRAFLERLTDDDLDAPAPERVRARVGTVGGTLVLLGTHVLMHAGQFVSVRRKLNKPVSI